MLIKQDLMHVHELLESEIIHFPSIEQVENDRPVRRIHKCVGVIQCLLRNTLYGEHYGVDIADTLRLVTKASEVVRGKYPGYAEAWSDFMLGLQDKQMWR